jgi:hypothetical protein
MSKRQYSSNNEVSLGTKKKEIHPVWRGIGILMLIIIPVISFILALLLIQGNHDNHWFAYPAAIIIRWQDPLILVKVILTVIFIFIFYGLFTFITALAYRIFGSPRYGPTDVPPEQFRKIKR